MWTMKVSRLPSRKSFLKSESCQLVSNTRRCRMPSVQPELPCKLAVPGLSLCSAVILVTNKAAKVENRPSLKSNWIWFYFCVTGRFSLTVMMCSRSLLSSGVAMMPLWLSVNKPSLSFLMQGVRISILKSAGEYFCCNITVRRLHSVGWMTGSAKLICTVLTPFKSGPGLCCCLVS